MTDAELTALLDQANRAITEDPDPAGHWRAELSTAWILVALGRHNDAIAAANRAHHGWRIARQLSTAPYGGSVLWEACAATAVAHLATGNWTAAEESVLVALRDFDEEQTNYYLLELALQAQGRLPADRLWKLSDDPARELATFDARAFAITHV